MGHFQDGDTIVSNQYEIDFVKVKGESLCTRILPLQCGTGEADMMDVAYHASYLLYFRRRAVRFPERHELLVQRAPEAGRLYESYLQRGN